MKINFKKTSIIYFSGTGNTAFLAQNLSDALKVKKYSIEENLNWSKLFDSLDYVVLMYPIYGSLPPLIMRDFVLKYGKSLEGKQFISIVSQMMYSGDGARVIGDYLPQGEDSILYGAHVNMPNNIPNIPFVPLSKGYFRKRKVLAGQRKIQRIAMELKLGHFKRQGFNKISQHLGGYQRPGFEKIEKNQSTMVRVTEDCIGCRECVKICPCNNFEMIGKKASPQGHCTLCFRCVNHCKAKAIRVLIHKPVKNQYRFE